MCIERVTKIQYKRSPIVVFVRILRQLRSHNVVGIPIVTDMAIDCSLNTNSKQFHKINLNYLVDGISKRLKY